MSDIRSGVRRLFSLGRRTGRAADADADAELRAFIDARVEYLVARGMSPAEARLEAEARLGGSLAQVGAAIRRSARQRTRRLAFRERATEWGSDLRYAARGLRRDPLVTVFIVVTLALGIGANGAMFGVVDRLLLRGPEHVREPERIMRLYSTTPGRTGPGVTASFGYVTYALLASNARSLDGVAAYEVGEGTLGRGAESRPIIVGRATSSFFPLLGVRPALGRFFSAEEDSPSGAQRVAVIGYELWMATFGGDSSALGATVVVGDEPYLVIGVAPRGFTGVSLSRIDVWTPLSLMGNGHVPGWTTSWSWTSIRVIGRLKSGVTPQQAAAEATAVHAAGYTGRERRLREARHTFAPLSYNDEAREPATLTMARWLMAMAAIVLLIACTNVVNLLLARSSRRHRELAIRQALGAGRGRLVRLLLAEGALLCGAAAAASLAVAYLLSRLMRGTLLVDISWSSATVHGRMVVAVAAIAVACGVVIGILPALQARETSLAESLAAAARIGGPRRSRLRTALTLAQAALSVLLLLGAGLFLRSVRQLHALPLGVDADRVLAVPLDLPWLPGESSDPFLTRRAAFTARVLELVRREPGVERAALSIGVPFGSQYGVVLYLPGRDSTPALTGGSPRMHIVGSDYFATAGTPIVFGRSFTAADHVASAERVIVVSELIARSYWPGEDALGKCIIIEMFKTDPCARVAGIAANTYTRDVSEQPGLQFYVPVEQTEFGGRPHLLVRASADPAGVAASLRRVLLEVDPTLPYIDVRTVRERLDPQLRPWRLGMTVFTLFGMLATLVAAAGLYGLAAYLVTTRTHEIGVRMALGATSGRVGRAIVGRSVAVAGVGIVVGLIAALVAGRFVEPLLFRTSSRDPVVIGMVSALMLVVAAVAALVPALRAARIAPATALRSD